MLTLASQIGEEWELEQRVALRRSKAELVAFLAKQKQEKESIEAKKIQRAKRVEERARPALFTAIAHM